MLQIKTATNASASGRVSEFCGAQAVLKQLQRCSGVAHATAAAGALCFSKHKVSHTCSPALCPFACFSHRQPLLSNSQAELPGSFCCAGFNCTHWFFPWQRVASPNQARTGKKSQLSWKLVTDEHSSMKRPAKNVLRRICCS